MKYQRTFPVTPRVTPRVLVDNSPGNSRLATRGPLFLGSIVAGLYFWASEMAFQDCINLGVC